MLINQITATLNLAILIPLLGLIITLIMNIVTIVKMKQENKDKMATKVYVNDKISGVEDIIKEHKKDNIREHDSIKTEFHNTVKALDHKFDAIIRLLRSPNKVIK